jgi:hypothetical protein
LLCTQPSPSLPQLFQRLAAVWTILFLRVDSCLAQLAGHGHHVNERSCPLSLHRLLRRRLRGRSRCRGRCLSAPPAAAGRPVNNRSAGSGRRTSFWAPPDLLVLIRRTCGASAKLGEVSEARTEREGGHTASMVLWRLCFSFFCSFFSFSSVVTSGWTVRN